MKDRKTTLRIVGKKVEWREVVSGALRRDVLETLQERLGVDMTDLPTWLDPLMEFLERKYIPRCPSLRDQIHFMTTLGSLVAPTPPANAPETVAEAMHYLGQPLALVFDEEPQLRFFPDSPYAGERTCICSYCEEVIQEAPVIRFFNRSEKTEARLHKECLEACTQFGLLPENTAEV